MDVKEFDYNGLANVNFDKLNLMEEKARKHAARVKHRNAAFGACKVVVGAVMFAGGPKKVAKGIKDLPNTLKNAKVVVKKFPEAIKVIPKALPKVMKK